MATLGIRARIVLLVILCAIPTLGLTLYSALGARAHAVAVARAEIQRLAGLAAQQQAQIVEGVRLTLVAVSIMPADVRNDTPRCNDYLATLLANSGNVYHSIGIVGVDGQMQCNSRPWPANTTYSDRRYFSIALSTGKFAIGDYQIGRTTKLQGINLSYPMTDAQGKVTGVAFVGLDLNSLNKTAATVRLPEQGVLVVADHEGIVLARNPPVAGRIGEKIPYPDILKAVLAGREGEFDAKGQGDLNRLIAFSTVAVNPDGSIPMRVLVSVPRSVILANADRALMRDVAGILIATVLLLVGAWFGTDRFVLRNLRKLQDVANRVHGGDLTARTGLHGSEEISHLGGEIDEMTQSLQDRDTQLRRAMTELQEEATIDPLTGLYNRRYLWGFLQRELLRAQRAQTAVAAIMLDIDHFKRFNDTWGHQAGDVVLKRVAEVLRKNVRGSDIACRYGGEEMLVILADATAPMAQARAEAMRATIEAMRLDHDGKPLDVVTASFGIAVFPDHAADAEALVRKADEAMYAAKEAGRNRVQLAPTVQAPSLAGVDAGGVERGIN